MECTRDRRECDSLSPPCTLCLCKCCREEYRDQQGGALGNASTCAETLAVLRDEILRSVTWSQQEEPVLMNCRVVRGEDRG